MLLMVEVGMFEVVALGLAEWMVVMVDVDIWLRRMIDMKWVGKSQNSPQGDRQYSNSLLIG